MNNTGAVTNVPLKERVYIYRGRVVHQMQSAAKGDEAYWTLRRQKLASQAKIDAVR